MDINQLLHTIAYCLENGSEINTCNYSEEDHALYLDLGENGMWEIQISDIKEVQE